MSDPTETDEAIEASVELDIDRADLLLLSDGRPYEKRVVVEADDGTTVNLSLTIGSEAADGP